MLPSSGLTRHQLGALGEQHAVDYLHSQGLRIIARNWRCRYGELDVIAVEDDHTLVFVEVKTRTGEGFGGLAQAVTVQKLHRLRRLAGLWLAGQNTSWAQIRIDIIGVQLSHAGTPEIVHMKAVD